MSFKEAWYFVIGMLPVAGGWRAWSDDPSRSYTALFAGVLAGVTAAGILYGLTNLGRYVARAVKARIGRKAEP